ncbi:MAG: hypothetical protein ACLRXC_09655 [[Clostridium] leptum]
MNRFSYWWTKLRLRAAGCAVRWAKKQVLLDIQNSRRATMLLKTHISGLSGFPLSGKNSRCASSACRTTGWAPPILGIRFDAGEITLSGTAEDIPFTTRR